MFVGFVFITLSACAPAMQSQRVSLDESDKLASNITDKWVAKDTQLCVQDILKQIENHKSFQAYMTKLGRRPKLFVSEVQNRTSEAYFPIADMNDELLNEFSASGDYILIDASSREKLLGEIQYQNDGMVDAAQAKSIGKASGADLLIFGDIRMKPESSGGKTIKDYTVNLRMTDIQTGEEVLRVRFRTSKYSVQKKSGW
jgi:PBP1b-binding outer membrane lipoprotein LpoB